MSSRRIFPSIPGAFSLLVLMGIFAFPANADDLQGAQALIQQLNRLASSPNANPAYTIAPLQTTSPEVTDFSNQLDTLSTEAAGQKWADLAIHLEKANEAPGGGRTSLQDQGVFQAIPAPASWPAIQNELEAHASDSGLSPQAFAQLSLIVHTLTNSEDKQWTDLRTLSTASEASGVPGRFEVKSPLEKALQLGEKLSAMAGSPEGVESFWKEMLGRLETAPPFPDAGSFSNYPHYSHMPVGYGPGLDLPDFVTLLGAARAEPLLLQALRLPSVPLSSVGGLETQRLARKLALENINSLKQPPWALTESMEGAPLYEALRSKFPSDSGYRKVTIYYVIALVTQNRSADALKAAADIDSTNLEDATEQASEHGWGMEVYDFLHGYLAQYPDREGWSEYVTLAAQTSHAAEALRFVQDTLARKDLNAAAKAQVLLVLYRALLANDRVEAGIAQLRALIEIQKNKVQDSTYEYESSHVTSLQLETDLARLGHVLKRSDLEHEGIAGALQTINAFQDDPKDPTRTYMQPYDRRRFASFLMSIGHDAEAEKLLIDSIVQDAEARQTKKDTQREFRAMSSGDDLVALAQVYYETGRWNDIVLLLQQAPGWDAPDLAAIASKRVYEYRYSTPSLGLMAARAFAETGNLPLARTILDDVLRIDGADDAAYELLLKIGQGDLAAKLDTLYHQDQFENRPLIWKAVILLHQGKIEAAQKACKAAIAVDPSDGQSGKGDRMRVYSVMADIETALKDTKQAAFFTNVVKAIRLSENADDFFDAGLLTQAVGMYSHALDLFSDAYCIQSRIARQLAQLGRMQEAIVHYRKAFELMPVSFGRMESHCFGCEHAFQGKTAEDIADQTFTGMLLKDPGNPQLHYLLGYLRMEQEQYARALPEFVKATQLDPDYINAWKQIAQIGQDFLLAPDVRDEAVFNLIRLDPAGRHITANTGQVRQLGKLWTVVENANKSLLPEPLSLLPLQAGDASFDTNQNDGKRTSPRQAILQNDVIESTLLYLR